MALIDETHDPQLESWVESANQPDCDFPIQNLPVGVFVHGSDIRPQAGVAIGDSILSLRPWLSGEDLREYLAISASDRKELRLELSSALRRGSAALPLVAQSESRMLLPCPIPNYTDFYASIHHAANVGRLFRPDAPLLPNYRHVPIAYHGRASSIVVSGTRVRRPSGQLREGVFGACEELDYEIELAALLGPGTNLGEPIPINYANEHWAGVCLLNDWSARDIQRWEYQPLGPFLAKNFATSVSPWIITAEALAPFRAIPEPHEAAPLPYLASSSKDALDITLEVWFRSARMDASVRLSQSNFRSMYWTLAQMIAHHTSNGCNIQAGDLIASGTVSGPSAENRGCLLELTAKGREPITLPNGERRAFLENGDEVILRGYCARDGFRSIGLGECSGTILPAISLPPPH
ncbi:MAG: fumarylacetoacetase [Bryobacteraceae bacterium]